MVVSYLKIYDISLRCWFFQKPQPFRVFGPQNFSDLPNPEKNFHRPKFFFESASLVDFYPKWLLNKALISTLTLCLKFNHLKILHTLIFFQFSPLILLKMYNISPRCWFFQKRQPFIVFRPQNFGDLPNSEKKFHKPKNVLKVKDP